MNVSLSRQTAHRFEVRWSPRPDFVQVERVSGPDLTDAIEHATALLAANGMTVVSVAPNAIGNATLVVEEAS